MTDALWQKIITILSWVLRSDQEETFCKHDPLFVWPQVDKHLLSS